MTLQKLFDDLKKAQQKLDDSNIDDLSKIELELLIEKIRKKIIVGGFNSLTEISNLDSPDISKLPGLINEVDGAIEDEKKRKEILEKVISIAKTGLNSIGIPL